MAFRFEELKVWQMALSLSNEVDLLAKNFRLMKGLVLLLK